MKAHQIFDDKAGKLGTTLSRDGVERTRLSEAEMKRLLIHSQNIEADCTCLWQSCKICRSVNKLKYYTNNYRILKALVEELGELKGLKDADPKASLTEVAEGVLRLHFEDAKEMCSTFLRFQEYYESPQFANKTFTLDEFKEWYQDEEDEFTYYEDWSGFNIPSWVLEPFLEGKFDPLSHQEKWFLRLFRWRRDDNCKLQRFYIIGTAGTEDEALRHETAHGLFYVSEDYKTEVQKALTGLKEETLKEIRDYLSMDYYENSLEDEVHAYTMERLETLEVEVTPDVEHVCLQLNEIYDRYWKKLCYYEF